MPLKMQVIVKERYKDNAHLSSMHHLQPAIWHLSTELQIWVGLRHKVLNRM